MRHSNAVRTMFIIRLAVAATTSVVLCAVLSVRMWLRGEPSVSADVAWGEPSAGQVCHADVESNVKVDLAILRTAAWLIDKHPPPPPSPPLPSLASASPCLRPPAPLRFPLAALHAGRDDSGGSPQGADLPLALA